MSTMSLHDLTPIALPFLFWGMQCENSEGTDTLSIDFSSPHCWNWPGVTQSQSFAAVRIEGAPEGMYSTYFTVWYKIQTDNHT